MFQANNNSERQKLGKKINTLLYCIDCRMETECNDTTRNLMLGALSNELASLNTSLEQMAKQWEEKLPYGSERPLRVNWEKMSQEARQLSNNIKNFHHTTPENNETTEIQPLNNLSEHLEHLSRHITKIYELLQPINSPGKYAGYYQDMLREYDLNHWMEKRHEWEHKMAARPARLIKQFCENELQTLLDKLEAYEDCNIISKDHTTIYQEAVGIKLWNDDTDEQKEAADILYYVRSALYLAEQCKKPLKQIESEPMDEEHQETTSQQEQATVARPIMTISPEKLEEIKMHYERLECFLENGYTHTWIERFFDNMSTNNIENQLYGRKIYKPMCHILGDLCRSKVYKDSTTQLAEEIWQSFNEKSNRNYSLPSKDSLARYIRQGLDNNEKLHTWIENYVKDTKK